VHIQPVTELELAAVDELEGLVGGAERVDEPRPHMEPERARGGE
jgi:hypothetical protein